MDPKFSMESSVKYFRLSGVFIRICGLLSDSKKSLIITSFHWTIMATSIFHFGVLVYLEFNTMELMDLIEYSHLCQLFILLFSVLTLMYLKKKDLIEVYLATSKGLYKYPWGNWTNEINIRSKAEKGIHFFFLVYPAVTLMCSIQQIARHGMDPSRQPSDPWFKGWVPFPVDSRIVTIYQILVTFAGYLASSVYFTYIVTIIERLVGEMEILKSILRDPHYIAINTNYNIDTVLKCCVQHQHTIYKYFNIVRDVLKMGLLSLFINETLLLCTMGLLITDSSISTGIKAAIGTLLVSELIAVFWVCYYCQKIYDSSQELCFSIYQMRWYELKPYQRKVLIIIMIISQKQLILTGGGIKIFNLKAFREILTTSYSYMSMLRAVRQ